MTIRFKWSVYAISFFAGACTLLSSFVLADEIPDLTTDPSFRTAVERALDTQESVLSYSHEGKLQRFFVNYGRGYLFTHAVRLNTFEALLPQILMAHEERTQGSHQILDKLRIIETALKAKQGSLFLKFLQDKAIYEEEPSLSESTRKYSVYVLRPGTEEKQGPYFSFSLTLLKNSVVHLDNKYIDSGTGTIHDAYRLEIARLLTKMVDEKVRSSPDLMKVRNGIDLANYERDTTPDLNAEERAKLDKTIKEMIATEQMIISTRILPELTLEARIAYIQKIHPDYPEDLILAVMDDMSL